MTEMQGAADVATAGALVISRTAQAVDAKHGALYLRQPDDAGRFGSPPSYAFHRRKGLPESFGLGDGLVGQCALEGNRIEVTGAPGDYVEIVSGLGKAEPVSLILTPDQVRVRSPGCHGTRRSPGVLRGRRRTLGEHRARSRRRHHRDRLRAEDTELLRTSQAQAEELQAQEEELRATNDQLTQREDQLSAQNAELEETTEELRSQKEELRASSERLETQAAVAGAQERGAAPPRSHLLKPRLRNSLCLRDTSRSFWRTCPASCVPR